MFVLDFASLWSESLTLWAVASPAARNLLLSEGVPQCGIEYSSYWP